LEEEKRFCPTPQLLAHHGLEMCPCLSTRCVPGRGAREVKMGRRREKERRWRRDKGCEAQCIGCVHGCYCRRAHVGARRFGFLSLPQTAMVCFLLRWRRRQRWRRGMKRESR